MATYLQNCMCFC